MSNLPPGGEGMGFMFGRMHTYFHGSTGIIKAEFIAGKYFLIHVAQILRRMPAFGSVLRE